MNVSHQLKSQGQAVAKTPPLAISMPSESLLANQGTRPSDFAVAAVADAGIFPWIIVAQLMFCLAGAEQEEHWHEAGLRVQPLG